MRSIRLSPPQVAAFRQLRSVYPNLTFVLVGATALSAHVELERFTSDVDLMMVAPLSAFNQLLGALGWKQDPRRPHRWYSSADLAVDVLPGDDAAIRSGRVSFSPGVEMSTVGFDLVIEHAELVEVADHDFCIHVASLPTLVILKTVAWLDRPHERMKDIEDIGFVMRHALGDDDCRWDFDDPVGGSGLDYEEQSYFWLGLNVASVARGNHRRCLRQFLIDIRSERQAGFARMLRGSQAPHDEDRLRDLLNAFERGLDYVNAT